MKNLIFIKIHNKIHFHFLCIHLIYKIPGHFHCLSFGSQNEFAGIQQAGMRMYVVD